MSKLPPIRNAAVRRQIAEAKRSQKSAGAVQVLAPEKPAKLVELKDGTDAKTAQHLTRLFTDANNGMRRIVALGLFAWEVKETKLKHGEWGPWLAAHCPKLTTVDSDTKKVKPSRALQSYMDLTRSVLENVGFPTIEKYLATVAKCANDAHLGAGKFLLVADKKVPEDLRDVHQKICQLVDGKTQKALFSIFQQAEDDGETIKVKHGRLKGQGGATKEQRANAEELESQEQITERKLKAVEIAEWLVVMADDQGLGQIKGTPELAQLDKAMRTARAYLNQEAA
jgi:hypothetical protein